MTHKHICVAVALRRYVDVTPVALRQAAIALPLARAWGAEISFITVEAPITLLPHIDSIEKKMARFLEKLDLDDLLVRSACLHGKPSVEIEQYVQNVGVDLLVMGSHSKRGPLDIGLGSTAEAVSRHVDTPILLVRPTHEEVKLADSLKIPAYPIVFPYG